MPIIANATTGTGVTVGYHRARKLTVDLLGNVATTIIDSYPDEQAMLDNKPLAWQWTLDVPMVAFSGGASLRDELESALVSLDASPFKGGSIVLDKTDTLENAQARKWAEIKAARAVAEAGNFTYDGGAYQINIGQVTGCVTAAMLAKQNGQTYTQDWTLTDNTVRTLDADQMIAMGLAMLATIDGIYKTGRDLRDQINAATTIEAMEAIAWPA